MPRTAGPGATVDGHTLMDITTLVQAVQAAKAYDAFQAGLGAAQWQTLATYLWRRELPAGELLIRQGEFDRVAYFVEQGNLQVFVSGQGAGAHRISILRPGALVGEPGLFAAVARSANVEAMTPSIVWGLGAARLDELCARAPALALPLLRAAGAVMAVRMRANLERGAALA